MCLPGPILPAVALIAAADLARRRPTGDAGAGLETQREPTRWRDSVGTAGYERYCISIFSQDPHRTLVQIARAKIWVRGVASINKRVL